MPSDGKHQILIMGLPYFAQRLAKVIASDDWMPTVYTESSALMMRQKLRRALMLLRALSQDVAYQVGGPTFDKRIKAIFRTLHRPAVLHWVGSDVSAVREIPQRMLIEEMAGIIHWVDAPWLQSELNSIGIAATVLPSFAIDDQGAAPFSREHLEVLLYLPDSRWQFYSGDALTGMAASMPTIEFTIVGSKGQNRPQAANIHYCGWVKGLSQYYDNSHVFVRLPEHDGLSAMVVEALAHARHVLWNHELRGVTLTTDVDQVRMRLSQLDALRATGELQLNHAGREYALQNFSSRAVGDVLRHSFRELLASPLRAHAGLQAS